MLALCTPIFSKIIVTATTTPSYGSPTDPIAVAMILAGVAILAVIVTLSARKKLISRAATPSRARVQYEQLKRQAKPGDDADVANARLHERAQQLAAVLDNKAARLEQLIADVDQRIQTLEKTQSKPKNSDSSVATTASARLHSAASAESSMSRSPEAAEQSAAERVPTPPDTKPPTTRSVLPTDQTTLSGVAPSLDPLTQTVYNLADTGLSSVQIAQRLDEQIGKVDLILALRPTQVL